MNKKGLGFIMLLSIGLAILVISIVASIFGLVYINKLLKEISPGYIIGFVILLVAIVFRPFVMELLMTILTLIKSIFGFVRSLF